MKPIPIYDATAPTACTIDPTDIPERIALVEAMRTRLALLERTDHGLLLHFAPDPNAEADLRRFAVDEKRCCQFWGFAVATTDHDLTLRWDGPPNTAEILDHLEAFFNRDAPASTLAALL
ncbi:MAG: hypothetical protein ACRD1K_11000 [Acidimicrobiales bacterium]